jgi:hypothetical protein
LTDHAQRTDMPYVEVSAGPMRARILTESGPRIIGLDVEGLGELMGSTDVTVDGPLGAVPLIGGHRLWAAPETPENTYLPDTRVRTSSIEGGVRAESDDSRLMLAKAIEVTADGDRLVIDHTLVNRSSESREVAAWGLTMVRRGGRILIPAPEVGLDERGLQARFAVVTWPYTNMQDERFTFDDDGVAVTADGDVPFKIGVTSLQGLVTYEVGDISFHKRIEPFDPGQVHVDLGAVIQVYVGGGFCEIETLGPLRRLAPGDLITHREVWEIG